MKSYGRFITSVILAVFLFLPTSIFGAMGADTSDHTKKIANLPSSYFELGNKPTGNSVAKVLNVDVGINGVKFVNPYDNTITYDWVGTFNSTVDNNTAKLYCIDLQHNLAFYSASQPHTYSDSGVTPSAITYILNNYYPYKSYPYTGSASNVSVEAAAVQMAVWYFSDGVNPSTISYTNPTQYQTELKSRALAIIADANANSGASVPVSTLIMNPFNVKLNDNAPAQFKITVYNEKALPAKDVTVTLSTSSGTLSHTTVKTNAQGETPTITLNKTNNLTATITATANVTIPQGTRFVHKISPDTYQKLVLATPTVASKTTTLVVKWTQNSDLSLQKSVTNSNPNNGDNVTFTITANNGGPSTATGVKVSELLPKGLTYVSHSASVGSYDKDLGAWVIPQLASGSSATLTLTAKVEVEPKVAVKLGAAAPYNLFVLETLDQPSSDAEGKVAVGLDCKLAHYSVGYVLPNSNGQEDVLVVGRNLIFQSGDVFGGNVVYGNVGLVPQTVGVVNGTVRKGSLIDFDAAGVYLRNLSTQVSKYAVNGTYTYQGVTLRLTGTDPFINVFKIPGNILHTSQETYISAPNGSVVIVNVDSTTIDWSGNLVVQGTSMTNCLFNFYCADSLTIQSIDVTGSVLAPLASVNFVSGVQHGQMICKNLTGIGQFNLKPFIGNVPLDSTLVNVAEVINCDQMDPDSSPANGVPTEDDYASASVHVGNTFHSGNGTSGTGTVGTTWQAVGNFASDEIVWTITYDLQHNLLAGTWGGKIYKSTDLGQTFTQINPTMTVGFIWSLKVDATGNIFAGTERGLYKSSNNGTSWVLVTPSTYDVRALATNSGILYAGIWGLGVMYTTDKGANWVAMQDGLDNKSVHALAASSNGAVYVGTFGGGVYKASSSFGSWVKSSIDFPYVWSLGLGPNNTVYAGTYGNGAYKSTDGGTTFLSTINGLTSSYIYGVNVDPTGNVFLSAWNGGIYLLSTNKTEIWRNIGLEGFAVSSIMVDATSGKLYAGTSKGKVFVNDTPLSIDKIQGVTPTEFELGNNYPNPFNPSTNISFSVPQRQNVNLSIYNTLGELVATVVNTELEAGKYTVNFDASKIASGVYIYRLTAGGTAIAKKMILTK